jgi:signal transduction histidine kinase/CheY-like chemotaxis protein
VRREHRFYGLDNGARVDERFGEHADARDRVVERPTTIGWTAILEEIARGEPLAGVLERLARRVDAELAAASAILVFDEVSGTVAQIVAPSLSEEVTTALRASGPLGSETTPWGAATSRGECVDSEDLASDPCWRSRSALVRALASAELHAATVSPVASPAGDVLGVFVLFRRAASPAAERLAVKEEAIRLASIAMARERRDAASLHHQKMKALETLAGGVTHDLNNLLTVISGNTHIALDELTPGHSARDHLSDAMNATNRATALLAQLATFSRREDARREVVSVDAIVNDAVRLLRALAPPKLRIDVVSFDGPASVLGDPAQLRQLVLNLGTNAAQAIGDAPGAIAIRVDVVSLPSASEQCHSRLASGRYVRLGVRDDGCGMERATVARIFEPFFTTRTPGRGAGLGLSMAYGIVENHGGVCRVESEPGKGTLFEVLFPFGDAIVAVSSPRAPSCKPTPAAPCPTGQHILFVDDDEALVYIASRQLERLGYRVSAFDDPFAAFEAFQATPTKFDALVTDLGMVGMTGIDLSRSALAIRADIPIIITSGYVRNEDVRAAAALGIHDLVLKPNSVQELALMVKSVLTQKVAVSVG